MYKNFQHKITQKFDKLDKEEIGRLSIDNVIELVNSISVEGRLYTLSEEEVMFLLKKLDVNIKKLKEEEAPELFVSFSKIKEKVDVIYKIIVFPMLKEIASFILKNYDTFDTDNSLCLERREIQRMLEGLCQNLNIDRKIIDNDIEQLFMFLDLNEDGQISLAEFKESECLPWIHSILFFFNDTNNRVPDFLDSLDDDQKFQKKIPEANKLYSCFSHSLKNKNLDDNDFPKIIIEKSERQSENLSEPKDTDKRHEHKKQTNIKDKKPNKLKKPKLQNDDALAQIGKQTRRASQAVVKMDDILNVEPRESRKSISDESGGPNNFFRGSERKINSGKYNRPRSNNFANISNREISNKPVVLTIENVFNLECQPQNKGQKSKHKRKKTKRDKSYGGDEIEINSKFQKGIMEHMSHANRDFYQICGNIDVFSETVETIWKEMHKMFDNLEKLLLFLTDSQKFIKNFQNKWRQSNVDSREIINRDSQLTAAGKIEYLMDENNFNKRINHIFENKPERSSTSFAQQLTSMQKKQSDYRQAEEKSLLKNYSMSSNYQNQQSLPSVRQFDEDVSVKEMSRVKNIAPNIISKFENRVISAQKQKNLPNIVTTFDHDDSPRLESGGYAKRFYQHYSKTERSHSKIRKINEILSISKADIENNQFYHGDMMKDKVGPVKMNKYMQSQKDIFQLKDSASMIINFDKESFKLSQRDQKLIELTSPTKEGIENFTIQPNLGMRKNESMPHNSKAYCLVNKKTAIQNDPVLYEKLPRIHEAAHSPKSTNKKVALLRTQKSKMVGQPLHTPKSKQTDSSPVLMSYAIYDKKKEQMMSEALKNKIQVQMKKSEIKFDGLQREDTENNSYA